MEEPEGYARRGTPFGRDWTKGSIIRNLWLLSWPMIVSSSLNMLGPTIDMIWVGKLGSASIAGVGVAGMAVMLVNSAMMGLNMGLRAMVARSIGAGDVRGANHVTQQAFVLSAGYSIVVAVIGILFAEPILILLGVEADVVAEGAVYLRIHFVGSAAMSFRMVTEGAMQASGDSVTPMKIGIIFRILHVALCPFLIFGWWIFPYMGVSGAAMTNVISQSLGTVAGLWILFTGRSRLRLTLRNFRLDLNIIWRIVRIGLPASVAGMERSIVNLMMMWFIVPFGTLAVAAHTLMQRIEMILLMTGMGLGQGAGVLAGQNVGAGQPERAERTAWLASGLVTAIMVVGSAVVLLWPASIIGIFNTEPGLVEITTVFLKIQIAGFLVLGVTAVLTECLNGVGDTMIPMLATLVTMWGVQLPMAYFLSRLTTLGVYGVRWSMVIALAMRAVTYVIYFWLGRWKRKRV